jgi:hypothetical protein
MHPVDRRNEAAQWCIGVWWIWTAWLAYKYSLYCGIKTFRSMKYNSLLNLVCTCFSFPSKPPVSVLVRCWPWSCMLGICFCICVMVEVHDTSSWQCTYASCNTSDILSTELAWAESDLCNSRRIKKPTHHPCVLVPICQNQSQKLKQWH